MTEKPLPRMPRPYTMVPVSQVATYFEAVARRLYKEIYDDHDGSHEHCAYCRTIREVNESEWPYREKAHD